MTSVSDEIVFNSGALLAQALVNMRTAGILPSFSWDCATPNGDNATRTEFDEAVKTVVSGSTYLLKMDKHGVPLVTAPIKVGITTKSKNMSSVDVGMWGPAERFTPDPAYTKKIIKRFFRVGESTKKKCCVRTFVQFNLFRCGSGKALGLDRRRARSIERHLPG
jgi:hypothetical protein